MEKNPKKKTYITVPLLYIWNIVSQLYFNKIKIKKINNYEHLK